MASITARAGGTIGNVHRRAIGASTSPGIHQGIARSSSAAAFGEASSIHQTGSGSREVRCTRICCTSPGLRSALTIVSTMPAGAGTYRKPVIVHAVVPVIIDSVRSENCGS